MSASPQRLTIGMVTGGPEATAIDQTIRRVAVRISSLQESHRFFDRSTGTLNAVFHLPGRVVRPDYAGLRTAKFSRKQETLMVQVAVPESIVDSSDDAFVFGALRQAAKLAAPVFAKANIPFAPEEFETLLDRARRG